MTTRESLKIEENGASPCKYNRRKPRQMDTQVRESGINQSIIEPPMHGSIRRYQNQISISMSSEEGSPSTPLAQTESCNSLSANKSPTLSRSFLMTSASLLSAGFRGTGNFDGGNRVANASWCRGAQSQEERKVRKGPKRTITVSASEPYPGIWLS